MPSDGISYYEEGGTTLVHSLPAPLCTHPGCTDIFQPDFIETRWPKILQVNPDTGAHPRLTITPAFTVSDRAGNSVTYELVGTVSFDPERKHYTSKIMFDGTTFAYDDLIRRGALVP